jgi:hypothetical protein
MGNLLENRRIHDFHFSFKSHVKLLLRRLISENLRPNLNNIRL